MVTPKQFEQLKNRVSARKPASAPQMICLTKSQHKIILGVDPSLRGTGYGVIQLDKLHPVALDYGTISCSADWHRSQCLAKIAQTLRDVIRKKQSHRLRH